jgi:hypothetical protein
MDAGGVPLKMVSKIRKEHHRLENFPETIHVTALELAILKNRVDIFETLLSFYERKKTLPEMREIECIVRLNTEKQYLPRLLSYLQRHAPNANKGADNNVQMLFSRDLSNFLCLAIKQGFHHTVSRFIHYCFFNGDYILSYKNSEGKFPLDYFFELISNDNNMGDMNSSHVRLSKENESVLYQFYHFFLQNLINFDNYTENPQAKIYWSFIEECKESPCSEKNIADLHLQAMKEVAKESAEKDQKESSEVLHLASNSQQPVMLTQFQQQESAAVATSVDDSEDALKESAKKAHI